MEKKDKNNAHREEFVEKVIESLEKGKIPWEKDWENSQAPMNPVTGTIYKGSNNIVLNSVSCFKDYEDHRWMTYKQAQEKNWQVREGEKGTKIEYFSIIDKKTNKPLNKEMYNKLSQNEKLEYDKNLYYLRKTYTVFNGQQIDGIPELQKEKREVDYNKINDILVNSNIEIKYGGDRAFYSPEKDIIALPPKEVFKNENSFYGTALHELAHSTGHPQRLNRDLSGRFGTESYAKEELKAEFASVFIGQEKGLNYNERHLENSNAYLQSWINVLKNDPNEIFIASKEADKISTHVLKYEKEKQPKIEKSLKKELEISL